MKITNNKNLPRALVKAIEADDYDSGGSDFTATSLLKPSRQWALQKKYAKEITEDVEDLLYPLYGKLIHKIVEHSEHNLLNKKEVRHFIEIDGFKISAQIDNLELFDGVLSDWKFCGVYQLKPPAKPEWTHQLNIQNFCLSSNGIGAKKLQVVALARDFSKIKAVTTKTYPQNACAIVPIEKFEHERTLDFIKLRIDSHQSALKKLPECGKEERWKFDMRCKAYCNVSKYCEQYQSTLKKGTA